MKKLALLLPVLALAACDRPQYDMQMVCEDGAKGQLLVDAKIYKSHADLVIKRLSKELRDKAQKKNKMWLADHSWIYNQIPEIDDVIEISVPVNEKYDGYYELAGKIEFNLGRDNLTGGRTFILWLMSDNNLTMDDGEVLPNGIPMGGVTCRPVIDAVKDVEPEGITPEIKNCMNYVGSQLYSDLNGKWRVYDENTGREMHIDKETFEKIFNGIEPNHFYLENLSIYPDDAVYACDVAARLRAYIAAHIDAEYISEPENVVSVSAGQTMTISCYGNEKIVIRGE